MGKRGPRPSGKYAKKGATLGARVTIETRKRLEAARDASGRTLSEEVETRLAESLEEKTTEDYLARLLKIAIERTKGFTRQDWLTDLYTFDLMVAVILDVLNAFRPEEGVPRMPDSIALAFGLDKAPEPFRREVLSKMASHPPSIFAHTVAGSVVIALQARGSGQHRRDGAEESFFKEAAERLEGLLTSPILQQHDREPSK